MATTTQTNTGVRPSARPIVWGRWLQGLLAAALVAVGLALLSLELALLPAASARVVAGAGSVAVMVSGAALAGWGWTGWRRPMPAFAVERGGVECGELVAVTGAADLQLRAFAGTSHLAVGQFPSPTGPKVEINGTGARLALVPSLVPADFAGAPWSLALARGLPWELDLRSGGGHLDLNLHDLSVASLRVQSGFGNVDLTLPTQGPAALKLRLALGDLAVTVPVGVEAKLRLMLSPLVGVSVDERRFINVAPNEWMTPLYPTTAQRCTVLVDMSAGDLRIA